MRSFVVEMVQDPTDDAGLGDEGEDLHLGPAARTGQRVDLVDTVDELGPSLGQRGSRRGRLLIHLTLWSNATTSAGCPHAIGVSAVEMDQMFVGLGDMDEHSSQELQWVKELLVIGLVPGFGLVDEKLGLRVKAEPGQVHRGSHEIAGEPVKPLDVVGIDGGVIVNAET